MPKHWAMLRPSAGFHNDFPGIEIVRTLDE